MKTIVKLFIPIFIGFFPVLLHGETAVTVVISEIKTTGGSGYSTDEFIELYNPADSAISLSGWQLMKHTASGSEYTLVEDFGGRAVGPRSFFLIAHPTGYLGEAQPDQYYTTTNSVADNNAAVLIDAAGAVVDTVGFGTSSVFESAAAPNPGSGKSLERKARADSTAEEMAEGGAHTFLGNGEDSGSNAADFTLRADPEPQNSGSDVEYLAIEVPDVPGEIPKDEIEDREEEHSNTRVIYSDTIIITELFPNPEGKDDGEFIELYNGGAAAIDVESWQLGDGSSRRYTIAGTVLQPGQYLAVEKASSGISLNNTSDAATLYWPDGTALDSVSYSECEEAQSYGLVNGEWLWSDSVTPGEANQFTIANEPPVAVYEIEDTEVKVGEELAFDGSDSADPDGDALTYRWDFGNGDQAEGQRVAYAFASAGRFTVTLLVQDPGGATGEEELELEVTDYDYSDDVVLSELLPSCSPSDRECEFIELFNGGPEDVALDGWQLTDLKTYYRFGADSIVVAGGFLVVKRSESKITLNNGEDTVYLLGPGGAIINGVEYGKAPRDQSFSFNAVENKWAWIGTVTPGGENVFGDEEDSAVEAAAAAVAEEEVDESEGEPLDVAIADVSESLLKQLIRVRGEVESAKSTGIHLMDEFGNTVRIYIQKKTGIAQPDVEPGDTMEVVGVLDKTSAGLRILPRTDADITVAKAAADSREDAPGSVLGDSTEQAEAIAYPTEHRSAQVRSYLYAIAGACALLIIVAVIKKIRESKKSKSTGSAVSN
ncbi:MAG: lamin tail domain-containing protein [Patescibacteria group bacterium]